MKTDRFGPFQLDPAQGILYSGRVVSKRELIDRVWPDSHVEENNLAQEHLHFGVAIRKVPISLKLAAAGIAAAVIPGGPFLLDRRLAELE